MKNFRLGMLIQFSQVCNLLFYSYLNQLLEHTYLWQIGRSFSHHLLPSAWKERDEHTKLIHTLQSFWILRQCFQRTFPCHLSYNREFNLPSKYISPIYESDLMRKFHIAAVETDEFLLLQSKWYRWLKEKSKKQFSSDCKS